MGLKNALRGKRAYFDANIFIYLLEGSEQFEAAMSDIRDLIADNEIQISSCDLIFTEMLPFHARKRDQDAIEHIIGFLSTFEITDISKQVSIHAGILRGETGMKTPDAIHVASAIQNGCDVFVTNDGGIRVPEGMLCILLSEFSN